MARKSSYNNVLDENQRFNPVATLPPLPPIQAPMTQQQQIVPTAPTTIDTPVVDASMLGVTPQVQVPNLNGTSDFLTQQLLAQSTTTANRLGSQLDRANGNTSIYEQGIQDIFNATNNKYADEALLRKQSGIAETQKQINELSYKVRDQNDALGLFDQQTPFKLLDLEGQGNRQSVVKGRQSILNRDRQLERSTALYEQGKNIAQVEYLQGNVKLAEETITKAIDLKYKPLEDKLNQQKYFLDRNDTTVTKLSAKEQEAQKQAIDIQLQNIQGKKQEEATAQAQKFQLQRDATQYAQERAKEQRANARDDIKFQREQSGVNEKPLSGDASKLLAITSTMVPEIRQLQQKFKENYRGTVAKILSGTDPELSRLVSQVADKVGRIRSGGAVNTEEEKRFKSQIVKGADLIFGSADKTNKSLEGLILEANTVSDGLLSGSATAISNQKGGDPLGLAGGNGFDPLLLFSKK